MGKKLHYQFIFASLLLSSSLIALSSCSNESLTESVDSFSHISLTPVILEDSITEKEWILSIEGLGSLSAISDANLTWIDMMHYAAQDEYLAQAEYLLIMDTYGAIKPYTNIALSEAKHLELLNQLFAIYGLPFPSDPSAGHTLPPVSLLEAGQIGVQAELDNIAMYEHFMTFNIEPNMVQVFQALKLASMNHLSAFQRQVVKYGG